MRGKLVANGHTELRSCAANAGAIMHRVQPDQASAS